MDDERVSTFIDGFKNGVEKQAQAKAFLGGAGTGAAAALAGPYVWDKVKGVFEQEGPSREELINQIRKMRSMRQRFSPGR